MCKSAAILFLLFTACVLAANTGDFRIDPGLGGINWRSSATALQNGGLAVVWVHSPSTQTGHELNILRLQRFDAQCGRLGETQNLTVTPDILLKPAIADMADGGVLIVRTMARVTGNWDKLRWVNRVYGRRYDAEGNPTSGNLLLDAGPVIFDKATVSIRATTTGRTDGGFVVAWDQPEASGRTFDIYLRNFNALNQPIGSRIIVNTQTAGEQRQPAITGLADGGFVVAWVSRDGSGYGVFGQRFDAQGQKLDREFRVNSYTKNHQTSPAIARLTNGTFVVIWQSSGQDGSGSGIYGQRFDTDGSPIGKEFPVNTYTRSRQYQPSVSGLHDGGFVVSWTSTRQDRSSNGIYGQRFNADGTRVGAEFRINQQTRYNQSRSTLTAVSAGRYSAVWNQYGPTNRYGVFGGCFDY